MDLATFLVQCLNSVQYGLLLFLVASGLTLIFGIMGVINLAHGSLFMIGAYIAYVVAGATGSLWLSLPLAVLGAAIWGLGASLGFPVGMSAAADDPERAAARVSVVSTIGYTAFLAGPPLLGYLGDHFGTLHSLLVVAVLLVPSAMAVPAAEPPRR